MRVKICGIRSADEAAQAVAGGADALGFLVGLAYPAADSLSAPDARAAAAGVPPFVARVLVTHRTDPAWIAAAAEEAGCDTIQLHGGLEPGGMAALRRRVPGTRIVAVVHVTGAEALARARDAARDADAVLLDTRAGPLLGGTGLTHDWEISARIASEIARPVILAGGLTPENVAAAIRRVRPFAVDVNSGVEEADGSKSPARIRAFVDEARRAGAQGMR